MTTDAAWDPDTAWDPGVQVDAAAVHAWTLAAAINSTAALLNLAYTPDIVWAPLAIAVATAWAVRRVMRR